MSEADKMFEELGYKKQYDYEAIYYFIDIETKDSYIVFKTDDKSIAKVSCYRDAGDITMKDCDALEKYANKVIERKLMSEKSVIKYITQALESEGK